MTHLLSIPAAIRCVLNTTLVSGMTTVILAVLIWQLAPLGPMTLAGISLYLVVVSVFFGALAGLLRVVTRATGSLGAVLRLLLETTRMIAADYVRIHTGAATLPPAGELLEKVHSAVFLPVLEKTAAKSLGMLATPLLWVYRRTVAATLRRLVRKVSRELPEEDVMSQEIDEQQPEAQQAQEQQAEAQQADDGQGIREAVTSGMSRVHQWSGQIERFIALGVSLVDAVTTPVHRGVSFLAGLLLLSVAGGLLIPVAVAWYLGS